MKCSVWVTLSLYCFIGLLWCSQAYAHDLGDGAHITTIIPGDVKHTSRFEWQLEITVQELVSEFPKYDIDENGKLGPLEYGAINAREVVDYVLPRLNIANNNQPCNLQVDSYNIVSHRRADYIQFPLQVDCPAAVGVLKMTYDLFFDENPYHQGTWTVIYQQQPAIQYFWEDERTRYFELATVSSLDVILDFIARGIHHIAIGFDHLLFLVSLLLPAVLFREGEQWRPLSSGKVAFRNIAKIITVFTLAHSVTLSMAVIGVVPLPPGVVVESIIALSIIIMAIHNIHPLFRFDVLLITFLFGLVHGFGFANVLLDYPLSDDALVISLVAFNVGVELGQLVVACLLVPVLFYCRNYGGYRYRFMPLISGLIAVTGFYWLMERLFG